MSHIRHEGKTNDVLIAFVGYVNDLNKLQQFKVSVQKSHLRLQCTFQGALGGIVNILVVVVWTIPSK
jgi:hypothetical protein